MLKYIGTGFLVGVPAQDLTDQQILELGLDEAELIKSGLYEKVETKMESAAYQNKQLKPTTKENK